MLRKNSGCIFLRPDNEKQIIENWEKQIDNFWSSEKRNKINSFVFDNCIEYQEREKLLTDDLLCQWASDGIKLYWPYQQNPEDFIYKHKLPTCWLFGFKAAYGIVGASTHLKILGSFFKQKQYNGNEKYKINLLYFIKLFFNVDMVFLFFFTDQSVDDYAENLLDDNVETVLSQE